MSMIEESEAASVHQKDRKVRSDDWNGVTANERYEALNAMDKCAAMAVQKMHEAGMKTPELIARQESAAVRAERELLEVLDTFDDKHLPHGGSRAREVVLSSRGEVGPDSLRLENGDWASAGEYVIEGTDSGAPIQFAKVLGA